MSSYIISHAIKVLKHIPSRRSRSQKADKDFYIAKPVMLNDKWPEGSPPLARTAARRTAFFALLDAGAAYRSRSTPQLGAGSVANALSSAADQPRLSAPNSASSTQIRRRVSKPIVFARITVRSSGMSTDRFDLMVASIDR